MAVPYTFASATGSLPLSQLDSNFATTITLGNTAVQLGNTVTTLNNMVLANVTVTSVATSFPNSYLANSTATLGNTTITLGSTTSSVGNLTLSNVTITSGTFSNVSANISNVSSISTDALTVNGNNISATNSLGFRNRIINGDMRIDQRNAGAAVTVNNTAVYTVDRWLVEDSCDAVFSAQRSTDVPSGQGFTNSLQVTATTADANIGSTQFAVITQIIEGFNAADLNFGNASAVSCTVSFWVKATVAGQYSCTIYNNGASRINPQAFTINSSNTWERKTITFAGDTTGTWLTDNGRGIAFNIYIALGSSFLGAAGWNSSGLYGVTGQANAVASVNNIFSITGVQLEAGSVATPFERRPYGTELALCQRYFQKCTNQKRWGYGLAGTPFGDTVKFAVYMRSAPTVSQSNTSYANSSSNTVENTYVDGFTNFANVTSTGSATLAFDWTASAEL